MHGLRKEPPNLELTEGNGYSKKETSRGLVRVERKLQGGMIGTRKKRPQEI